MKYLYLKILLILCLLTNYALSQPSITWQRTYVSPLNLHENFGEDICSADDGNFYIIGSNNQPGKAYIIKINSYGDTIWTRFIDSCGAYAGVMSGDGGCVFTGERMNSPMVAYTIKINSSGDLQWSKYYNSPYSVLATCTKIIKTNDSGYIICGHSSYIYAYVLKINSNGDLQWQKTYKAGFRKEFNSISEAYSNGYLCTGVSFNTASNSAGVLDRIDMDGNLIWERTHTLNDYKLVFTGIEKKNNLYITGDSFFDTSVNRPGVCLVKLDTVGNIIFFKAFAIEIFNYNYIFDMRVLANNRYVFCTDEYNNSLDTVNAHAFITDSVGNIIADRHFTGTDETYLKRILPVSNGDIMFVGESNFAIHNSENAYVVRSDSDLYVPPIGMRNLSVVQQSRIILYPNYPNPFNPSTKIRFNIPLSRGVPEGRGVSAVLTVYDILGREITSLINQGLPPGTYEIEWDGTNYPSGAYFYKLQAGDFAQTRKMVLLK